MFLLFGTRASEILLTIVTFACGYCGQTVPQRVVRLANKFTLFFIPLFPISSSHYVQCSNCGGTTDLTRQQADNSLAWAAARA